MTIHRDLREANRKSWNEATRAHNSHKGDQAAYLREPGNTTLFQDERELLGDISGRRLLHLQCNAGQDTLSLAKLGAQATGVDISDEAVAFARQLSADSGIAAEFERADLYDWFEHYSGPGFDKVFTSYGTIGWLPDLRAWARGIAKVLKPGAEFAMLEFHPVVMMYSPDWQLRFNYFEAEPQAAEGVSDYVAVSGEGLTPTGYEAGVENFQNPHPSYEFYWGVGDVVTALAAAGLLVSELREYPYANGWRPFERMRDLGARRYATPQDMPLIPMMFGLRAVKPA